MAQRCATLEELLETAPEFASVGPQSTNTLTVTNAAAVGTLTLLDQTGTLPVQETYLAGTDWTNGGTTALTATAISDAINAASSLVTTTAIGAVVHFASVATGSLGLIDTTSNDATMVWTTATLEGGDVKLNEALACTCLQIQQECWTLKASCGHTYLAAHVLALMTGIGADGTVKKKRIKDLEIEFGTFVPTSSMDSTRWGQMYQQIKGTLMVLPFAGRKTLVCL